jgi:hypothetical protein
MLERQFYCVSCRKKVTVPTEDICVKIYKNKRVRGGSPALIGHCNKCDTRVSKFIQKDKKEAMINKFGKC